MKTLQERVFKINKIIFQLSYQKCCSQSFIKIERQSQELCPNFNNKTVPNDNVAINRFCYIY